MRDRIKEVHDLTTMLRREAVEISLKETASLAAIVIRIVREPRMDTRHPDARFGKHPRGNAHDD